jgi:uncharacterized membrane protein
MNASPARPSGRSSTNEPATDVPPRTGRRLLHPANQYRHDHRTNGQHVADSVTGVFGSWRFIVVQTVIVVMWNGASIVAVTLRWNPYPFERSTS